ncbi:hypothetical protein [Halorussus halobius]|uniref:hypothetical protein n=1 Tax=Halorussus halobius TaxID=1710537 RepID=UPI00143D8E03|nr:hypothetical protein [Halorussus halobius]
MADDSDESRSRDPHDDEASAGLSFSLPPITLPEVHLPERVRLVFPVPEPPEKVSKPIRVDASWGLVAVAVADALDAVAVVWAGPEALAWARAAVGLAVGVALVGAPGLLYVWELLATVGGMGWLALAPTLTALVVVRLFADAE